GGTPGRAPGLAQNRRCAGPTRGRAARSSDGGTPQVGKRRSLYYPYRERNRAGGIELTRLLVSACAAVAVSGMLGAVGDAAAQSQINGCTIQPRTVCPAADLAGAELSMARLRGANLSGANLAGANLRLVDLRDADLSHA